MGRIRTIKPEFWQNEVMARLPAETRLLAIALLNHADDHGYFLANPHLVRAACCPFMEASVNDHGTITEASVIIQGRLRELSSIGWIELKTADDGRLLGRVVNFKLHQYVQRPQKSKIAAIYETHGMITERSRNDHGTVSANSGRDQGSGIRDQGSGIREQGSGIRENLINTQPDPTPSSREGENPKQSGRVGEEVFSENENSLPEPLRTPEFEAAWKRWLDFRMASDGRLNPIQQQLQLKTCVERGAEKAARDLDASILGNSKGQIFDSERFSRRKPEAKPEDDRAFPTHFRIGTRNIPVAEDGSVRCPFADKPTLLGRYAEDGEWHWLVDEAYMKSFEDCEKNGIYVFWRDYPDLMRPEDVAKYQRRVQKQKLNRV